jgi:hypothetical protein
VHELPVEVFPVLHRPSSVERGLVAKHEVLLSTPPVAAEESPASASTRHRTWWVGRSSAAGTQPCSVRIGWFAVQRMVFPEASAISTIGRSPCGRNATTVFHTSCTPS